MDNIAIVDTPMTDADYEAEIERYLAQIKQLQEKMRHDRKEILALKTETDATLDDIMQIVRAA